MGEEQACPPPAGAVAAGAAAWTVTPQAITPEGDGLQLSAGASPVEASGPWVPHPLAATGSQAGEDAESPAAESAGGLASAGQLRALGEEVAGRLDALAAEMRHTIAAALLAHSVTGGQAGQGAGWAGRGSPRPSSAGTATGLRRQRHWSFGHVTTL